jgi:hypothetical protein
MKYRKFQLVLGVIVLGFALLACNLPANSGSAPATSTSGDNAPTSAAESTTASQGNCGALNLAPKPSGIITGITMAEDVQGDAKDPVNPTTVFANNATFHAVVAIANAPANTVVKSVWYAYDTNGVAACNTKIDEYELTTDGSRNIDFSLTPNSTWPAGTFRVEVYINGTLDTIANFSVK